MTPSRTTFQDCRRLNEEAICSSPGCNRHRIRIDVFCSRHRDVARRLGDPRAKPIRGRPWVIHAAAIRDLWALNPHHEGLAHWTEWAQGLLDKGTRDPSRLAFAAAPELARLAAAGVTGRDLILEAIACSVYLQSVPHLLPSDRARDFAVARAVIGLVARPRVRSRTGRPRTPRDRRGALSWLARTLREGLSALHAMTTAALAEKSRRQYRTRAEVDADRRKPLATHRPMAPADGG
jgi:hypothetical protein